MLPFQNKSLAQLRAEWIISKLASTACAKHFSECGQWKNTSEKGATSSRSRVLQEKLHIVTNLKARTKNIGMIQPFDVPETRQGFFLPE